MARNVREKVFCVARHSDDVLGAYCTSRNVYKGDDYCNISGIENFPM